MEDVIHRLLEGKHLTEGQAEQLMHAILDGRVREKKTHDLLLALHGRGETVSEVVGFARALREKASRVTPPSGIVVGLGDTGGPRPGRFEVAALAALVVATAGVRVAMQGQRSSSGHVGAADVLEALGVPIDLPLLERLDCLRHTGFAFFDTALQHPTLRDAAAPRRQLGVPTVCDLLGPLVDPVGATHRLLGVDAAARVPLLAEALMQLGCKAALVVHGEDCAEAVSPTGPTMVAALRRSRLDRFTWRPGEAGLQRHSPRELAGGDVKHHMDIARSVLHAQPGAYFDAVILHAGAALFLSRACKDLWTGVQEARLLLQSGQVQRKLQEIDSFSRHLGSRGIRRSGNPSQVSTESDPSGPHGVRRASES